MTTTTTPAAGHATEHAAATLSRDEVRQFHELGYLGPYTAMPVDRMTDLRRRIEDEVLPTPGRNPKNPLQARHLDHRFLHDVIAAPEIVGRLRGMIGADIVVWASYFFTKDPGGKEIPWHQDANFWPIEPPLNISIWMAVDEVTTENSCVQIIPGSHRTVVRHLPAREGMAFGQEADPAAVDTSAAVDMVLRPGEFFIFNERLLHHSHKNTSDRRRMGLSARYTVPFVALLDQDAPPLFPGHACVVVSGEDTFGLNRTTSPPPPTR
ncbi:phytanoyl-CoA dioxygenase family protein [Actinopolymorpha sp. B9G3]|uniref:phytanoyl-CoA dioxygenase family protein n=1 Tax=Actinopolymorpha sp. B9G3 TaxID=3158970 RepID=UPI0032D9ABA8